MRLFSYTVAYDYGSAPNPYFNVCTLAICKPVIRRVAEVGDWIAGLSGNKLVYAMLVTKKLTLSDYDVHCRQYLPGKIPDWTSGNYSRIVGDCIYDYSEGERPLLRESVHDDGNIESDLGGEYALLSDDFYYFGDKEIELPVKFGDIRHGRGHKSNVNDPYKNDFVIWLRGLGFDHNKMIGIPKLKSELEPNSKCKGHCSRIDKDDAEYDEAEESKSKC